MHCNMWFPCLSKLLLLLIQIVSFTFISFLTKARRCCESLFTTVSHWFTSWKYESINNTTAQLFLRLYVSTLICFSDSYYFALRWIYYVYNENSITFLLFLSYKTKDTVLAVCCSVSRLNCISNIRRMTDNVCTASPHSGCETGCDEYSTGVAVCIKNVLEFISCRYTVYFCKWFF